jgi:hypothetical protein
LPVIDASNSKLLSEIVVPVTGRSRERRKIISEPNFLDLPVGGISIFRAVNTIGD